MWAKAFDLTGWVQNLPTDVEVYAEGEKSKLEDLIAKLEVGPQGAIVNNVEVTWGEYSGDFDDFTRLN